MTVARYLRYLSAACILMLTVSCQKKEFRNCSGAVWATTYSITYSSPYDLADSIISVMQEVESSLSPFNSNSLISKINRNEPVAADRLLKRIFLVSQDVAHWSGGAFDPTVAPIVNLWGFGYDNTHIEPTQEMIDSALQYVGILQCRIDNDTIVKCHPETEFNFSAITKGYGCDLVGEMLHRNGADNYMIEIGGEIALCGRNPSGEPWHIQIDAPIEESSGTVHTPMYIIEATDCGIATSGNYRNFRETAQGKAWHTIDPTTGYPVKTSTLSATVIAPSCMMADALATACMAMDSKKALDMIEQIDNTEALIVTTGENGKFITLTTSSFPISLSNP